MRYQAAKCGPYSQSGHDGNSGDHRLARELPAIRLTIGGSILEIDPYTSTFSPAFAHS